MDKPGGSKCPELLIALVILPKFPDIPRRKYVQKFKFPFRHNVQSPFPAIIPCREQGRNQKMEVILMPKEERVRLTDIANAARALPQETREAALAFMQGMAAAAKLTRSEPQEPQEPKQ